MKKLGILSLGFLLFSTVFVIPMETSARAGWVEWEPPTVVAPDEALKLIQSFRARATVQVDEEIVFTSVAIGKDKQGRTLEWTLAGLYYKPRQVKPRANGDLVAMVVFPGGTGNHLSMSHYRDIAAQGIPVLVIGPIGGYNFNDPEKRGAWSGPSAKRPPQFNPKIEFVEGRDYTIEVKEMQSGFYSTKQNFMIPVSGSLFESYMVNYPLGHYTAAKKLINEILPEKTYTLRISSGHSTGGSLGWPIASDPLMKLDIFNCAAEPFGGAYGPILDPERKEFQSKYDLRWSRVRDEDNVPYLKKQYGEDWTKYISPASAEEAKKTSWMVKPGPTDGVLWGRDWTSLANMAGIDPAVYNDLNWPVANGYRPRMIDVHFSNDIWNTVDRFSRGWLSALKKGTRGYSNTWFVEVDANGVKASGLGHNYTWPVLYKDEVLKGGLWPAAAELFIQALEKNYYGR